MASRYKLKLKQLDFVSLVDDPAQPNAKVLLIKRKGANALDVTATARLVKTSDELGLAFFWAFTSTNPDGSEHYDLHGDAVQADNDMIKAAAEFMEKGGAVDEMHDSDATGRVVFAMPMTPEIAKAFGVETKTSGLMVAIRPSADAMAKLKDGTYRAVSIAGLGERIEARKSVKVVKSTLYTTEVDGHQHTVRVCEDGSLYVDYATASGADYGHGHGIVFENGQLTILADSGHTHELAEGQPGVAVVPADAIVIVSPSETGVAMRAPASKSTQASALPHGDDMKLVVLTEAQHQHYSKLSGKDAEAYLEKSATERDGEIEKARAADPIVFTGEASGITLRKSEATDFALKIAKQAEASAVTMAKQADEIAKRDLEIKKARIRKGASDLLGGAPGKDETHDSIFEKLEGNEDEIAVIKGLVATSKIGKPATGINPGDPVEVVTKRDAYAALEKGLAQFCVEKNLNAATMWVDGLDAFVKTALGRSLHDAYENLK